MLVIARARTLAAGCVLWAAGSISACTTSPALKTLVEEPTVAPYAMLRGVPTDALYARFVDVGAGLCVVVLAPNDGVLVYDAGRWTGSKCSDAVDELVGERDIDLLVLSHGDGDHIGDVPAILNRHTVRQVLWTGDPRESDTWQAANSAVARAERKGTRVYNLGTTQVQPGTVFEFGDALATFVAGWHKSPWRLSEDSELRNVIGIVMRISFDNRHVLLTGDTIGREHEAEDDMCEFAEAFMVANAVQLTASVMSAPHHGGDNGSSTCFIKAVNPDVVVFSAGHQYKHPRAATVRRYLRAGIPEEQLMRTDRGDDEGGEEWQSKSGCGDSVGDDDIELRIPTGKDASIKYLRANICSH